MRRLHAVIVLLLLSALLQIQAGCTDTRNAPIPTKTFTQKELLIGLIPEQNIFRQRERYSVLKRYLSERLGITVKFTSLSRYGNIIDHFLSEGMDGAFFGSFTYALAHEQLGVEPLARPINLDGTSTYHGYVFVRKDSGIRKVADMRGKRFAFVEHATTAGYLFPMYFFRSNGVTSPRDYLSTSFFAGSHDAAILAVLNREADIGAAKNTIYDQMSAENRRIEQELQILSASGVVPQNGLAVRRDLAPELKAELKKILLDMDKNPEGAEVLRHFGARGFVETTEKDYAYVYSLCDKVGIHLKSYRYKNQ
ncbi:MAG: phosphate/phosphite/phosphonate ABC transporter substrate-binding protein [Nitrospiraceae bacterium]|nr:phosphate/phosphite/phosphonate ABC transporter substrate-binding protein [Nitrospiraceae bacterium]